MLWIARPENTASGHAGGTGRALDELLRTMPVCAPPEARCSRSISAAQRRYVEWTAAPGQGADHRLAAERGRLCDRPHGQVAPRIHGGHRAECHGFDYFYGFHSGMVDYFTHRFQRTQPKPIDLHDLYRNRTEIFEQGKYLTERITEEAVGFIEQNRSRPFFLYVAYNAVHGPHQAPEKYLAAFHSLKDGGRSMRPCSRRWTRA